MEALLPDLSELQIAAGTGSRFGKRSHDDTESARTAPNSELVGGTLLDTDYVWETEVVYKPGQAVAVSHQQNKLVDALTKQAPDIPVEILHRVEEGKREPWLLFAASQHLHGLTPPVQQIGTYALQKLEGLKRATSGTKRMSTKYGTKIGSYTGKILGEFATDASLQVFVQQRLIASGGQADSLMQIKLSERSIVINDKYLAIGSKSGTWTAVVDGKDTPAGPYLFRVNDSKPNYNKTNVTLSGDSSGVYRALHPIPALDMQAAGLKEIAKSELLVKYAEKDSFFSGIENARRRASEAGSSSAHASE
jgi:hypothetical protein